MAKKERIVVEYADGSQGVIEHDCAKCGDTGDVFDTKARRNQYCDCEAGKNLARIMSAFENMGLFDGDE